MWVDEFAIDPALGFGAELIVVGGDVLTPLVIVAEVDDFVILVHEGDAGGEIGDEHEVAVDVDVGGEDEGLGESAEVFAIEIEPLQSTVGPVGDAEGGGFAAPVVNPEAMGEIELAVQCSGFSDGGEVVAGGVVAVDAVGAVTIGDVETSVSGVEGDVGGHEAIATPFGFVGGVLAFFVFPGGHGGALIPDDVAPEGELGDGLHLLVAGDVEELLIAFLVDFEPVAAALELAAEGTDKASLGIEDEDGGMALLRGLAFVHDVEVLRGIDGDVVGDLPGEVVGEEGPVVNDFVLVLTFAEDNGPTGLAGGGEVRESEGGPRYK